MYMHICVCICTGTSTSTSTSSDTYTHINFASCVAKQLRARPSNPSAIVSDLLQSPAELMSHMRTRWPTTLHIVFSCPTFMLAPIRRNRRLSHSAPGRRPRICPRFATFPRLAKCCQVRPDLDTSWPNPPQVGPSLAHVPHASPMNELDSAQAPAKLAIVAQSRPSSTDVDQIRSKSGRFWPGTSLARAKRNQAKVKPKLAKFDETSFEANHKWINIARRRTHDGQNMLNLDDIGSHRNNFGQHRAKSGRSRPILRKHGQTGCKHVGGKQA